MSNGIRAAITGVGGYLPEKVLSNADLERLIDTTDEWIVQRTGISQRRIAAPEETTSSMAANAARRALASAKLDPADLDVIICATITPDTICPAAACYLQQALGATKAVPFDLSAACSGFVYGLGIASAFIESGKYKNILVIGADTLSRITDYTDRASCILFGDAAGAAIVQPTTDAGRGILHTMLGGDGEHWDLIYVPAGGSRMPASAETVANRQHYLKIRGREIYKFAVERMQWLLEKCMAAAGVGPEGIDLVVPHQVNIRIIESACERLGFPRDKIYVNIERYGNTSAASIPVALDEAIREGRCGKGSLLLLIAFGSGLTWAGSVVRL